MEIVGIGTEIVECVRIGRMIERHGEQFLTRVFTPGEIRHCQERRYATGAFAECWAGKEAVLKSLGLAGRAGLCWTVVELRHSANGPRVLLAGAAGAQARQLGVGQVLVSLANCRAYATAHAVAVRGDAPAPADEW